jgi:hypothetical protein
MVEADGGEGRTIYERDDIDRRGYCAIAGSVGYPR